MRKILTEKWLSLPDRKTYDKPLIIKARLLWQMKHAIETIQKIHNPKKRYKYYGNSEYDKEDISNDRGKDEQFSKWCWDNWIAIWKIFQGIKGLNTKYETIKVHKENMKEFLYNTGKGEAFVTLTQNLEAVQDC